MLSTYPYPEITVEKCSCGPDTAIDAPGPSINYTGCSNFFDALGLMNLSTIAPLVLPRALSTVVANNVSKLYMINASGGGFLPNFIFVVPWGDQVWCRINSWPCQYCYILGFLLFLWSWGSVVKKL